MDEKFTVVRAPFTDCVGEVRVPSQATSKRAPEETHDRAERGSAVRGSDQRASSPKRVPSPPPCARCQSQQCYTSARSEFFFFIASAQMSPTFAKRSGALAMLK